MLLQNPLNPGYPPRFRRSQTEVAGILGILGRRGFWDTPPSSSLECPSTTSRCGWPMASMASLGCELRKREAGQICPRRPSKDAFFLHNRSQSTEQMQRQDEDICKIEGHPQCVFSILTSSCGGVLTWRYLDVCNFPLGSFFVSLWPGPSVTVNCADFVPVRQKDTKTKIPGDPSLWTVQICLWDNRACCELGWLLQAGMGWWWDQIVWNPRGSITRFRWTLEDLEILGSCWEEPRTNKLQRTTN